MRCVADVQEWGCSVSYNVLHHRSDHEGTTEASKSIKIKFDMLLITENNEEHELLSSDIDT